MLPSLSIQFTYEGWTMKGLEPFFSPMGIVGVILFIGAISLFFWNLSRKELTHEQLLEKRNKRQPDVSHFREFVRNCI